MTIEHKTQRISDLCPSGYLLAIRMGFFFPVFEANTFPKVWSDRYTARGYMVADPVLAWCYGNVGVTRWSEMPNDDPRGVMGQASFCVL